MLYETLEMTRSKKNGRRAALDKGNSKVAEQPMKGKREKIQPKILSYSSELHQNEEIFSNQVKFEHRNDNCVSSEDVHSCFLANMSLKSSLIELNEENQCGQKTDFFHSPTDNTIYHMSMSSDDGSALSSSPSSSAVEKNFGISKTDSLARRLFKSSSINSDTMTSRVIARPRIQSELKVHEARWTVYKSPWDFGFHFKNIFGDVDDDRMDQSSICSLNETDKSETRGESDDANTDREHGTEPGEEKFQRESSDRWIGGPYQTFLCAYNMYWPVSPTYSWLTYNDPFICFPRPWSANDFWASSNFAGAISNYPCTFHPY